MTIVQYMTRQQASATLKVIKKFSPEFPEMLRTDKLDRSEMDGGMEESRLLETSNMVNAGKSNRDFTPTALIVIIWRMRTGGGESNRI
jgi:hypothetical protein